MALFGLEGLILEGQEDQGNPLTILRSLGLPGLLSGSSLGSLEFPEDERCFRLAFFMFVSCAMPETYVRKVIRLFWPATGIKTAGHLQRAWS